MTQAALDRQFAAMRGAGRPDEYRTKDGDRVPSTTTITGRFKDSAGLIKWANAEGLAGRKLYEDKSATDIGSLVHAMVEARLHGQSMPHIPGEYRETVLSAFASFEAWFEGNQFEVIATEFPLVSEVWRYGGTIDSILRDAKGRLCIGDWKTSNAIYADYLLQLAAYGALWDEHAPADAKLTGGFHLVRFSKEHGDMEHRHFPELDDAWTMFTLLRQSYELDKLLKRRAK
jgi:hypothetical protein